MAVTRYPKISIDEQSEMAYFRCSADVEVVYTRDERHPNRHRARGLDQWLPRATSHFSLSLDDSCLHCVSLPTTIH